MAKKPKTTKTSDVLGAMNAIAPFRLAEEWDNVGLQVGHPAKDAGSILVALEVTGDVIEEAKSIGATLIVAHHPLIFRPLKTLDESRTIPAYVARLVREGIALVAAHTNVDSVAEGTNGEIADRLKLAKRRFLVPAGDAERQVKYVVFVPSSHAGPVVEAISAAGAGVIGNYSHCTFRSPGTGTYKPGEGANPFAGSVGALEEADDEVRLEAVCPKTRLDAVIGAVRKVHPYEEVAFDVYPLEPVGEPKYGLGLVGDLAKTQTLEAFARTCKRVFGARSVGVVGDPGMSVGRVAVCSGAGGEAVRRWRTGTADVLVTGEMGHHECAEVRDRGFGAVLLGHFESEAIVCERLAGMLAAELGKRGFAPDVRASKRERSPIVRM